MATNAVFTQISKMKSGQSYTLAQVVDGAQVQALLAIVRATEKPVLYVALDDLHLNRAEELLRFFDPEIEVISFPAWDCIPYDRVSPNHSITSHRIESLCKLASVPDAKSKRVVITTVNALVQKVVARNRLQGVSFIAKQGDVLDRDVLVCFLVDNGYVNTGTAAEAGEFALRGSLIDIVPPGSDKGYRLDLFGNELETIRTYDVLTQISSGNLSEIMLMPACEVVLTEDTINRFKHQYRGLFGAVLGDDPLYEAVLEGRKYAGMEHWLPLFYEQLETVSDYLPKEAVVVCDALVEDARRERWDLITDSYKTRKRATEQKMLSDVAYNPISPDYLYLNESDWQKMLSRHPVVQLHAYSLPSSANVTNLAYFGAPNFFADSKVRQVSALELLQNTLVTDEKYKGKIPLIACYSQGSRSRLALMLEENEVASREVENWAECKGLRRKGGGKIGLALLKTDSGYLADDVVLISEQDILGERIVRSNRVSRKRRTEKFIQEASSLHAGELVVHKDHGIGRFVNLEKLTVQGVEHGFVLLYYADDDKLYVPVENVELISRYGASEEAAAPLDRLGGVSWQARTSKLKNRIRVIADELLQIAAKRELRKAPVFHAAGGAYEEFCARFPYTETDDQQRAIEEVLEDLTSGKPMDRLICGDVGFGKTEVALRAAFVVGHGLQDGNKGQVALIAPTTLLCRQHYQGFVKRFADMGLTVRQLSRMVGAKEERETKEMLEEGEVDIIVGTHALLAKDVRFKNLSLLIVDEEQRFGVAQKERLKKMRSTTHVLTLTATPIPRTLQLSLSGIRDLSLITTPPVDRLAVRTYVMPYDGVVIREALLREHYRGGRSFYVCPRIKDIEEMNTKLRELVPELKIVIAHGQMPPSQLDDIMSAFSDGAYDVLLATTIIESGIDIPQANTLVVHRSDMYGLAQLYQIRGRVGRSKVRAYAYMTLPPKKVLTRQAQMRLEVMQKLDTLGAGFTLASHDMDIRGFGNLLGDEQSGNIREVGVELYQAMLQEAIDAVKAEGGNDNEAEKRVGSFSPQVSLGTAVLIPDEYVEDLSLRLSLYRRIAELDTNQDVEAMASELIDRFGPLPEAVENLFTIVKLKQLCRLAGVDRVDAGPKGVVVGFYKDEFSAPDKLLAYIAIHAKTMKIRADQTLLITGDVWSKGSALERVKEIRSHLQSFVDMHE